MGAGDKAEEYKGRGKEAVGDLTGDEDMKREGKLDKASGKTKGKLSEGKEKISDALSRDDDK